ncbi:hypothetical protein ABK040_013733 [Willaertia magna]
MKTFEQDFTSPLQLEVTSEHFDYIDAVQSDEYYNKGIIIQLLFEKETLTTNPNEIFQSLLNRSIIKTDTCKVTILAPNIVLELPYGNAKYSSIKDLLEVVCFNLEDLPKNYTIDLMINELKLMLKNEDYCPLWFKIILEDPLGNSRIQCVPNEKLNEEQKENNILQWYKLDPFLQVKTFIRTNEKNNEFDIPIDFTMDDIDLQENKVKGPLKGDEGIQHLIELLKNSNKIVGLTGAGISTESSISAFRNSSSDTNLINIWDKWNQDLMTYENIKNDPKIRNDYFEMHAYLRRQIEKADPNGAHKIFEYLQEKGKLLGVITQNIDRLHLKNGILPKEKVIEIHGNDLEIVCTKCRVVQKNGNEIYCKVNDCLDKGEEIPKELTICGECGGALKPATISFGEALEDSLSIKAKQFCNECDLMLVMGTRLIVQPVNSYPKLVTRRGVPVVIINLEDTHFDNNCSAVIRGKCGAICDQIVQQL